MVSLVYVVAFIFAIGFVLARFLRKKSARPLNFPPGPPSVPFLGNLHQIPLKKPFLKFASWSREYGPIVGLHFGTQPVIILNEWQGVRDLLDQRGLVYSSRPYFPAVEHVLPGNVHVAFMQYDKMWRRGRKTITSFLTDDKLRKMLPIQDAESTQMIWDTLNNPTEYYTNIMRQFAAVILASVYGQRGKDHVYNGSGVVGPKGEGRTKQFYAIQDEWAALLDAGAMPPLDIFPFLKYVPDYLTPWCGWRKRSADTGAKQSGFYKELFQESKKRIQQGKSTECFVAQILEEQKQIGYTELEVEYLAGFLIEGGADTTAIAMQTFVVAMAAHPELQKKAQEEVDGAFGNTMPNNIEQTKFPYLWACLQETLRWRPGFPMAIPHATSKDDTYQGYFIPAGTTVIMNTWAIHHNPNDYPNSDKFDPSRFLGSKFGVANTTKDTETDITRRQSYAFGAGRRICAGQPMAENSMMMTMAKIVWAFDIEYTGEGKLDTSLETAWNDAILTAPKKFPLRFQVRGMERKEIIEKEWKKADEFLRRFEA